MTKDHWKAAAIALAGLLIVTNATGFYTRRVMAAETAERLTAECPAAQTPTVEVRRLDAQEAERDRQLRLIRQYREDVAAPLLPNQRCYSGERFEKIGNEWRDTAKPC